MKKMWKRNQLIITALVLLVGIAGYLNFSEKSISETWSFPMEASKEVAAVEPVETKEAKLDPTEENVGEAVFTNAKSEDRFYSIKLEREQTRAENKEILNEIINNANATEEQKNDAINSIMELADYAEKENSAETLLAAKGFEGAVVSMTKDNVDVVINKKELSEQELTQVEDIVSRKTGVEMEKIVISTAMEEKK